MFLVQRSLRMKSLLVLGLFVAAAAAAAALPSFTSSRLERGSEGWLTEEGIDAYNRIIGGTEADNNTLPYQAGVFLWLLDGRRAFCGGTLVSELHVLTAAHCWRDGTNVVVEVEVHLGAHIINEPEPGKNVFVSRNVIVHPHWTPTNIRNDVAVIVLPEPVEFSESIQPVALPPRHAASLSFAGYSAVASGWGITTDGQTSINEVLNEVTLTIITNTRCTIYYLGQIHSSHLCSEADYPGTCQGDSGGPLVTTYGGQDIVIGLTSFGHALGCERNVPSVFARITEFLEWISETTGVTLRN